MTNALPTNRAVRSELISSEAGQFWAVWIVCAIWFIVGLIIGAWFL